MLECSSNMPYCCFFWERATCGYVLMLLLILMMTMVASKTCVLIMLWYLHNFKEKRVALSSISLD
jgi:hypothetical protein